MRYMDRGVTRFYFVPDIASATLAPTVAEVTAGDRLDEQLNEVNGFTFASNPIDTPNFKDRFTPQISGEDVAEDSSLLLYRLKGEVDTIRAALAKDTEGFIVVFYEGTAGASPAAADKVDVWPVVVSSNAKQYTADNEAAKYNVVFSITSVPGFDLAVLA
jgi:hypothetical protein